MTVFARCLAVFVASCVAGSIAGVPRLATPVRAPDLPPDTATVSGTGGVPVVPLPPDPATLAARRPPAPAAWPAAGTAVVTAGSTGLVGTLPVSVATGAVRVEVLDQAAARRAGVTGVLLRVDRAGGEPGRVPLTVDYSSFRGMVGGDYGARLRLVELPGCALGGCTDAATPLPTRNDIQAGAVTAEVATPGLVAVTAAASGPTGSFSATDLDASARWQVGLQSGDFQWSYPLRVPPVPGPEPGLALSYSSGGVDGRTASSNNQPSWVGEGFDLSPGYIERSYQTCRKDTGGNAGNEDLCWVSNNAVAAFDGVAGELVRDDATGTWRGQDDNGWKVELLTGAVNGDNDGEHWRLTSPEGTQYYFGLGRLPGWTTGRPETRSAFTAPVFGNHAGEPCRTSTPATSWCQQAYRWNLDYVVDRYGDVASYYYEAEMNNYGRWNGSPYFGQTTPYVRGGYPVRIDYGQRDGAVYSSQPAARVLFGVADRCSASSAASCDPADTANWKNWPDVPWDERCSTNCTYYWTPSFWSTKRLSTVTTQVFSGGALRNVDSWALRHSYPDPYPGSEPWEENNDASRSLWLNGIVHSGQVGGTVALPEVTFEGTALKNRHNSNADFPALYKWRVKAINTETGGRYEVTYAPPECGGEPYIYPDQNVSRCYPRGRLGGNNAGPDVFYKYVVTGVKEVDRVGGGPAVVHQYEYVGPAAWHWDDSDGTATTDRQWNQWRGYGKVRVRGGDPTAGPQTLTEHLFLRGMDGDKTFQSPRDVWVTDSQGGRVEDHPRLRGFARETVVYNGSGGPVVSGTVNDPWLSGPIASRGRGTALDPVQAFQVDKARVVERTPLDGGAVRRTEKVNAFDAQGRLTQVNDLADMSTGDDDTCTRTAYASSPVRWVTALLARVEMVGVACGATPQPADLLNDERYFYDGASNLVRKEDATGVGTYSVTAQFSFDQHGREVSSVDSFGNRATVTYSPAAGGPVTRTTRTNALGHTSSRDYEVAWGAPVTEVDATGRRTDIAHDSLGRITAVWGPGRDRAAGATPSMRYDYLVRATGPSAVTGRTLQGDGGYTTMYTLHDGLLRTRQTQLSAPGGGRIVADTMYDSHGRVVRNNLPYQDPGVPGTTLVSIADGAVPRQTMAVYDGVGRRTADILRSDGVEKWRTTTAYGGDRVSEDPPDGGTATMRLRDADDRVVELRQYRSGAPSGPYDATRYSYTRSGKLATVVDAAGNTWRYQYDVRDRLVRFDDPDKGSGTFTYDEEDRVATATDARGRTLTHAYDSVGRPTGLFEGSVRLAEWTYDTLGHTLPVSSTRYVGGAAYRTETLGYDPAGRPTGTAVTVPSAEGTLAGRYETRYTYSDAGQLVDAVLPTAGGLPAETVHYGYDALGLATTLTGVTPYVASTAYTNLAEPARYTYGATGKQVSRTFGYDRATRRLTRLQADRQGTAVSDLALSHDPAGNVTRLADTTTADTQCFRNDHLRRLTEAWTPASGDCAAAPAVSLPGSPAPYWHSYAYDALGNRTSEVRHGAADVARTYAYPPAGSPQPHGVRTVTENGRTDSYTYDAAGNTVGRPRQTLTFDAEGQLATVQEGATSVSYVYDADGDRLVRRDATGTTLYLGETELRLTKATGAVTGTRYYTHDGTTVAVRTPAALSWLAADHHGTASVSIDADTMATSVRRFLPFGGDRGSVPQSWPGERGFVGGTTDPTGLTHLGAREYDPSTGQFISVDPVIDVTNPQQLHGYAYANNSPVTFSDPDGLAPRKCENPRQCDGSEEDIAKAVAKAKKRAAAKRKAELRAMELRELQQKRNRSATMRAQAAAAAKRRAELRAMELRELQQKRNKSAITQAEMKEFKRRKAIEDEAGEVTRFKNRSATLNAPPEKEESFWDRVKGAVGPGSKFWSVAKIGLSIAAVVTPCSAICGGIAAGMSAVDAVRSAQDGDVVGVALNLAGVLTGGTGSFASTAARGSREVAKSLAKASTRKGPNKTLRANQARMSRERYADANSKETLEHHMFTGDVAIQSGENWWHGVHSGGGGGGH